MWLRLYNVDWPESLSFLVFSVSSLWYAAADGEQAIRSESWRIYLCNPKSLSGCCVFVYVPAAVVWWRSRMRHGFVVIFSVVYNINILKLFCNLKVCGLLCIGRFKENQSCKNVFSGNCLCYPCVLTSVFTQNVGSNSEFILSSIIFISMICSISFCINLMQSLRVKNTVKMTMNWNCHTITICHYS